MQGEVVLRTGAGAAIAAAPPPAVLRPHRQTFAPYLLLGPAALFMAVFFLWPMLQAVGLAFRDTAGELSLQSLRTMVTDVNFWPALKDTLLLTLVIVPSQLVLALIMALLLMAGLRFSGVFLYVWAIPLGISDLASGIVWLAIFTQNGYVNSLLRAVGLGQITFLSYEQPVTLFLVAVLAEAWRATAIVMVILVAGLQVIPKDYAEAAEVFGATAWQRLRYVTLPLLRPSLQVALILRTILAFQVFAVVIALAGRNLPVLAGEAYTWYGDNHNVGVAAGYSLLIMVFSLVNTGIYLRALRVQDEQAKMVQPMTRSRWPLYALAVALTTFFILPIYLIAIAAISTPAEISAFPKALYPRQISFDTLVFFLTFPGVVPSMINSVAVALLTLVLSTVIGAPAGYGLARFVFRGRDAFKLLILITRAFPIAILAVPLAVTFINWNLYDSVPAVALVHTTLALPTTVLITSSIFLAVPYDLEEAAWTLGCTPIGAFTRVALPLAIPGIAAASIFTFVLSWNEVFAASILTVQNHTLPAQMLSTLSNSPLPYRFAGGFVLIVPSLVFIFIIRRYLLSMWGRVVK